MEIKKSGSTPVVVVRFDEKLADIIVGSYVGQLENLVQNPYLEKDLVRSELANARDIHRQLQEWQLGNAEEVLYPGERSKTPAEN